MRMSLLVLVLGLAVLTAGCPSTDDSEVPEVAETSEATADYPEWLERVYPAPGAELSVTQAVEVNHAVVTSERAVRLTVDGVDVTTYADDEAPGLLVYDPESAAAEPPVELEPGEHSAMVELLEVDPASDPDGLGYEVLGVEDTFRWTFTVL